MTEETVQDELTALKRRADQMGIKYHPKIGVDKLRDKVNRAIEGQGVEEEEEVITTTSHNVAPIKSQAQLAAEEATKKRKDATRLIRIRVNCMNPAKKDYEGEIFTVSNSTLGTFKKYVPYNAEEGWHVPYIIYEHLKERECQIFTTVRGPRGEKIRKGKLIKEFAIEVLDPLTPAELEDLARKQAMANNIG